MNAIKVAWTRRPVLVNSVVGYSVFAAGDLMAQRLEDSPLEWDHRRSLSIGLLGIVQNGLFLRVWYRALDKFVTPKVGDSFVQNRGEQSSALALRILTCGMFATSSSQSAFLAIPTDIEHQGN